MRRLLPLAMLMLSGCTAAEISSSIWDLHWTVVQMVDFAGPRPQPPATVSDITNPTPATDP